MKGSTIIGHNCLLRQRRPVMMMINTGSMSTVIQLNWYRYLHRTIVTNSSVIVPMPSRQGTTTVTTTTSSSSSSSSCIRPDTTTATTSTSMLLQLKRSMSTSTSTSTGEFANVCNHYIISSPLPPIPKGPYLPLYEFITQNWETNSTKQTPVTPLLPISPTNSSLCTKVDSLKIPNDKVSVIDVTTGLQRTFHDHDVAATSLAWYLINECSIKEITGTVAMFCPNHVDYLPVCLAVSLCGAKITPINPLYTCMELLSVVQRSRSTVIVVHTSKLHIAIQAANECPAIQHIILITDDNDNDVDVDGYDDTTTTTTYTNQYNDSTIPRIVTLNSIRKMSTSTTKITNSVQQLHSGDISKHPYCIPYSSGTTGLPKGVSLSHANIISNLLQCYQVEGQFFQQHHTLISPLPFFHIYAYTVSMLYTAWQGQTLITMSGRFDLEAFCLAVQKYQPNRAHLVPPILVGLAKHPIVEQYTMDSLNVIVSAAAPMSCETEQIVQHRLGGTCLIKQAWGMSELSPIGTFTIDSSARSGSVGQLVSSTFGKIINVETGQTLPPNTPGELCIKGPQVMMGYLDDPDKTNECLSLKSGWLRTGDIAIYDTDGYIYITDRIKELIKVNGFPVAPAELEALLLTHPNIADAAVISVPHETMGEAPRAYIVLKEESINIETVETIETETISKEQQVQMNEIYDWVSERVAPYKRLKGGIVLKSAIPKSASGKILRRILKDEYNTKSEV